MNTGTFAVISLDQFVVSAKFALFGNADSSDQDLLFAKWANEGIRHMDCLSIFKKQVCTIKIADKKGKLPNGFNRMLAVRFNVNGGCGNFIYVNEPFLFSCGIDCKNNNWGWGTNLWNSLGTFEIQDGYIYIHQLPTETIQDLDIPGQFITQEIDVKEVTIAYIGLNVDDSGLMKGYEDMERGITAYICYNFCLQNMDIPKYAAQKEERRLTWVAQKNWMKGNDFQNNARNERRQIMEWSNALLVSKNAWL